MKTLHVYAAILFSIFAINFSFAQTAVKKRPLRYGAIAACAKPLLKKPPKKPVLLWQTGTKKARS
jgi:hypothetical protein